MTHPEIEAVCRRIREGERQGVYLVVGDLVLAEPAGMQIAEALQAATEGEIESLRRPAVLQFVLDDLRTFSLFSGGKVRVVVESALFADRNSAAGLVDQASEALPVEPNSDLTAKQRQGAARLLQALRVFGCEPLGGVGADALSQLPTWAFQGGPAWRKKRSGRGRGKRQVKELQEGLAVLLDAAVAADMVGWAEGDLAQIGSLVERGLPENHHLVLVESQAQKEHPVVTRLIGNGSVIPVGSVSMDRRGSLEGVEKLADALCEETGVSIRRDALEELSQRTLRRGRQAGSIDSVTTGRFAAEYRKLANLAAADRQIDVALVRGAVEDRGEEDVFKLLDEISGGNVHGAVRRLERHLHGAEDSGAAVFGFFSLLAQYSRHVAVMRALIESLGLRRVERNYRRFQSDLVDRLTASPGPGLENPLAKMHPFRLHRIYLAAARWSSAAARQLPWHVLEAETRLKGDSSCASAVLSELVVRLALASTGARTRAKRSA